MIPTKYIWLVIWCSDLNISIFHQQNIFWISSPITWTFFCSQMFFSKFHIYMKVRNMLKRLRNQFPDFCDCLFLRYGRFCTHNWFFFRWILSIRSHNPKNENRKNRKINFSCVSTHCALFMSIWPLLKIFILREEFYAYSSWFIVGWNNI